jgi:HEPN domain-containing protein
MQAVQDWLANAQEDIDTAVLAETTMPPKRRAAVYHAQQATEKALKAYLTLHDRLFDLTHRLPLLSGPVRGTRC